MEPVEKNELTAEPEKEELKGKKFTAALSYLSWFVVVPMIYANESKFIHYHANQGLVLAIAETICIIATVITSKILWSFSAATSLLVETTMYMSILGVFGMLSLLGILNVMLGKTKPLPTFGKIKILKDEK